VERNGPVLDPMWILTNLSTISRIRHQTCPIPTRTLEARTVVIPEVELNLRRHLRLHQLSVGVAEVKMVQVHPNEGSLSIRTPTPIQRQGWDHRECIHSLVTEEA
jgi:hypothetical protein